MAVGKNKVRIMIQLDISRKELLQELAEKDGRSLSNYINWIISQHLEGK